MKASAASRNRPTSRSAPASTSHPPTPAPLGLPAAPEFSAAASLAPAPAGRPAAQPLESTQEPAPPKPQSPPKFCEYSFSESSSHALPRLDFSSTKLAFYPETDSFLQAAAALPLFFAIACQRSESLKIYHLFPEIDFCPDTLESSHAYLKPSAVWAQDLRG